MRQETLSTPSQRKLFHCRFWELSLLHPCGFVPSEDTHTGGVQGSLTVSTGSQRERRCRYLRWEMGAQAGNGATTHGEGFPRGLEAPSCLHPSLFPGNSRVLFSRSAGTAPADLENPSGFLDVQWVQGGNFLVEREFLGPGFWRRPKHLSPCLGKDRTLQLRISGAGGATFGSVFLLPSGSRGS